MLRVNTTLLRFGLNYRTHEVRMVYLQTIYEYDPVTVRRNEEFLILGKQMTKTFVGHRFGKFFNDITIVCQFVESKT